METADVIVAGGGIIGLSVALELAKGGHRVLVLERGRVMAEASWAAAGMLAAEDPENLTEISEFAAFSLGLYPEFLGGIEELSDRRVPLRTANTLMASEAFHCQDTDTRKTLSAEEAASRLPGLGTRRRSFLWLDEVSLDPRDLCVALPRAAAVAGVTLVEQAEVFSVSSQGGSVGVTTTKGAFSAGTIVNCCGAWSGQVQKEAAAVGPWKGQMHTVRLAASLELPFVVRTPEVYLVPRGEGLVVVGATVERAGFDRQIEPTAEAWLRALAADLWPPIASAPVVECWTGLRPGTTDGLPLIGCAGQPGCWIATGHFRNGILLAPGTAVIVRHLLEGTSPGIALDKFAPVR